MNANLAAALTEMADRTDLDIDGSAHRACVARRGDFFQVSFGQMIPVGGGRSEFFASRVTSGRSFRSARGAAKAITTFFAS